MIDGKTETDVRIFVLSRKLSPKALLETARDHWQIENALHWQHDVSFGEDAARNRKDNGPSNIAVIRRALDVAPRSEQGISDCQAEASGMERRVHAKAADSNAIALRPQGEHRIQNVAIPKQGTSHGRIRAKQPECCRVLRPDVQSVPAKRCHRSRQDFYCPVRSMTASVLSTGGGFHLPVRASDDALLD